MKTRINIVLMAILLFIGFFLQNILIGTSPKINCDEIVSQFYVFLNTIIVEYIILISIQLAILKFVNRRELKEIIIHTVLFTILYTILFYYLFNGYRQNICS